MCFQDQLSLNVGQKYCRMLKATICPQDLCLVYFERPFYTGFTAMVWAARSPPQLPGKSPHFPASFQYWPGSETSFKTLLLITENSLFRFTSTDSSSPYLKKLVKNCRPGLIPLTKLPGTGFFLCSTLLNMKSQLLIKTKMLEK